MIYLTGDTHGDFRRFGTKKWPEGKKLTKDDYVIILGDFGGIWNPIENDKEENYWLDWLDDKPFLTLFVDGNHENFSRLNRLEEISMFNDKVGKVRDSIYHLKRANIYTIDNKKFFVMGGAQSIDKHRRKEYISWWKEEIPSEAEFRNGVDALKTNEIDYVLAHTAPSHIIAEILYPEGMRVMRQDPYDGKFWDPVAHYFQYLTLNLHIQFRHWFFGHMHDHITIQSKYTCLYKEIIKL